MVYHNIYQSWSDGRSCGRRVEFSARRLREAQEETSISCVRPLSSAVAGDSPSRPTSRGKFVCAHVHLNVTYLSKPTWRFPLRVKPDENSGVRWFPVEEVLGAVSEPCMRVVYRKLMEKAADFS